MAELTDAELKERIKRYDPKNPPEGDDLELLYRKFGKLENFDGFDAETLEKAAVMIDNLKIPANLKDSLKAKISERQLKISPNKPYGYDLAALKKMSLQDLAKLNVDNRNGKIKVANRTRLEIDIHLAKNDDFVRLGEEWKQNHPHDKESLEAMKLLLLAYVPAEGLEKDKMLKEIRAVIAKEEIALRNGTTYDNVDEAQPKKENKSEKKTEAEAEDKEYKFSRFDEMTTYDLFVLRRSLAEQLEKAVQNGEDIKSSKFLSLQLEMDEIADYAAEQMEGFMINEDNAPAARDYIGILTAADASYDYDVENLQKNLDKYDKKYGLDSDLPTAEEINANENSWAGLTKAAEFTLTPEFKRDAGIQALGKEDPETLKETLEVLRTMALTELSLEKPDEDPKKAMAAYHEKIDEVSAQYLTAVNLKLQAIMHSDEETNVWLEDYLQKKKMTRQQWEETQKDPKTAEAAKKDFRRYIVSNVYTVTSAEFVERNDMFASRMAQKTNMDQAPARAASQKRKWAQKHPKITRFAKEAAKNSAWTYGLLFAAGPVGLTARTGWKLIGAVKTSYNNYKKSDCKNFFQYLGQNKEESYNLLKQAAMFGASAAFTSAMALSGALTFGALGSLTGLGASAAQTAGQAAANVAIAGLTKIQAMGALSAVTSAGSFFFARHKLAPKKKELMAILEKYAPKQEEPVKRSLLDTVLRKPKTPAEAMYKNITGTFKDLGDEEKVAQMLQEFAPNMSAEDKKAVVELAKEVQNIKAASYGAATGVVLGAGMAESPEIAKAFSSENQPQPLAEQPAAAPENSETIAATENAENPETVAATDNTENAQSATEAEASAPVDEAQPLSADKLAEGTDLYKATDVGPTVIYKKLISMGVMTQDDANKIMAEEGRSYIPSSVLREHLQDDIKMTPAQEKELNDFISDKETFKRLCDEENARAGIHHREGHSAGGNANANATRAAVPPINKNDDASVGDETTVEDKNKNNVPKTPTNATESPTNKEAVIRVTGKIKNHTGATAFLYQKHDHEVTLDLNKIAKNLGKTPEELTEQDKLNAQTDAYANTYIKGIMEKRGVKDVNLSTTDYSATGRIVDEHGEEHKIKVKNDYNEKTNIQTYTRKVETDHGTERVTVKSIHHEDGTRTSFGKFKNAFVDGATVGEADGGNDEMIGKVTDSYGNSRTFIKDGKTGDMYEVTKVKGQDAVVTKSSYTESQIKSLIKNHDERLSMPARPSRER